MRFRGTVLAAAIALAGGIASAAEADTRATPDTFYRLRDAKLEYHGPADDFPNLTELRIGWFGPTDLNDPLTGDLWWAANQAVREANADSAPPAHEREAARPSSLTPSLPLPPSLPFRLLPRWSVDVWGTGVSQLTRMVFDEQPLALIGSIDSASTHLAEQVVAKANLPLVSPIATDKTATLAGVAWMFSCAPSDTAIARALVDEILASFPRARARITLLAGTDHESRMTTREIMRELSSHDRLPDARFDLAPGVAISEPVLSALHDAPPDIIVLIAGVEDSARWVRAVRDRASKQPLVFGSPAMSRSHFRTLAGRSAEGVRFPMLWVPDDSGAAGSDFVAQFVAQRGHEPDYAAVRTYDSTRLLLTAIRHAGPNRARIREALVALSPWPGLAGPIRFDGTGQNTQATLRLGTIRGGAVVPNGSVGGYERERVAGTSTHSRSQPHPTPVALTTALSP
jgi:branched-chain amino acid transport system substrate-binding protein